MHSLYTARQSVLSATIHAQGTFSVIHHGREQELRSERQAFLSLHAHATERAAEQARWVEVLSAPSKRTTPRLVHARITQETAKARAQDFAIRAAVLAIGIGSTIGFIFFR